MARKVPSGNLTEDEEAEFFGVSTRTLRRWRRRGYGPSVTVTGRTYSYSPEAGPEFLAKAEKSVELPSPKRRRAA